MSLAARGLKPVAVLAASRQHGDRLRYIAGCRCALCRKANSSYESERQKARRAGDWNGIVSAEPARKHLLALSKRGVGRRAVQAATDIADSVLAAIRSGAKARIRARTARLILAVTPAQASDHALVPAGKTWRRVNALLEEGYTRAQVCSKRGVQTPHIQLGRKRVLAKTAYQVERIHRELTT